LELVNANPVAAHLAYSKLFNSIITIFFKTQDYRQEKHMSPFDLPWDSDIADDDKQHSLIGYPESASPTDATAEVEYNFTLNTNSESKLPIYMIDGKMIPVAQHQHYQYRGEGLQHLSFQEYLSMVDIEKQKERSDKDPDGEGI
jgi:hypothetical protein